MIWNTPKEIPEWNRADAHYHRSNKAAAASGSFTKHSRKAWTIGYRELTFRIRPTGFKHTGLFPEQAVNWDLFHELIQGAGRPVKILNLFAYTGGATLACAARGRAGLPCGRQPRAWSSWARENAAPLRPFGQARALDRGRLQKVCRPGNQARQPLRWGHHGPALLRPGAGRRGLEAGGCRSTTW